MECDSQLTWDANCEVECLGKSWTRKNGKVHCILTCRTNLQ